MTGTLTDRYVAAALRGISREQRPDIERELRASIADAIDDRRQAGADAGIAEMQVLTELGDPVRLAAGYTDRPLHLIGPALFLDYVRLLKVLLSTVVPVLFVAVGLVRFLGGGTAFEALRDAMVTVPTAVLHIVFWVTLVFAVIQRSPSLREKPFGKWDPAALPDLPGRRVDFAELIGGVVAVTLGACLLLLSQTLSPVTDAEGEPIGVIAPALWESGALYLAVLFAVARIGFDLVGYYVGWGVPQAVANAVLSLLFMVPAVWVTAAGLLLNDAFFAAVGWPEGAAAPGVITTIVVIGVILIGLQDAGKGFVRALRHRPRPTTNKGTR
ncbi:permease prefix domain 1-containing protein [Nonomuraea africana]|uniref:Uncharacterized protein n=1 Tax=Nonomuraea africana TaxID=46171 RepID=A0ABR9KRK9_9ACTN|nr:permease prefix domain 1-containing protein [Nonomuraea africana]MBE1564665.1 hypothetical protein [Nonomuraea africana]